MGKVGTLSQSLYRDEIEIFYYNLMIYEYSTKETEQPLLHDFEEFEKKKRFFIHIGTNRLAVLYFLFVKSEILFHSSK